ncbi:MAG: ABC transporter permease [Candidatus Pacebacteria bacterium]|nr:ABC transporter permease [Candidatus Paceibacterota bacterium]
MKIGHVIQLSLQGVTAKWSRTFLTLLGIAIGVSAVMVIASLGRSTTDLILNEISSLGADVFVVQAGRDTGSPGDITETLLSDSIKIRDVVALMRTSNVPHVTDVSPVVIVPGPVSYGNETFQPETIGGDASFFAKVFDAVPSEGDVFGEEEIKQKAFVAVIGSRVRDELFGNNDPLGEKITVKGNKFRVVGVLPKKGQVGFVNFDDSVFIPYTTAQTYVLGTDHFFELIVRVDDPKNLTRATYDAEATLRETHRLETGDENDFKIRTPEALMEQVGTILSILTIFLTGVVAIALVVGGIGIMNIMLVSVTERTREIGLRKAVGATDGDILAQFLLEAILLTLLGGAVGIAFGALMAYGSSIAIRTFSSLAWTYTFPLQAALIALGFSVLIGLIFGLYPARKASRKSPMEALRYE